MISLYNTLKESLLSGFDEIEASTSTDFKKEIRQFIKANYKTKGRIQISKEPNENGKYEVSCGNVEIRNKEITSLTNNLFEWNIIRNNFSCFLCRSLTSLEGAPKEVGGDFYCIYCKSLKTIEDAPKKVGGTFNCFNCNSLTSLEGVPKEVKGNFNCFNCNSLTSLEGAPEKVGKTFNCSYCKSLTSLEGAPKEVGGGFNCYGCQSLTSLKGAPEKVGGNFDCYNCGGNFTEEDVKNVCDVGSKIQIKRDW